MATTTTTSQRAWVTLLTRSSYLPGVITLAYTLQKHHSAYPLIVLTTPSLPASSLCALTLESQHNTLLRIHPTTPLLPPPSSQPTTLIAARFEDTWTKLRAFSLTHFHTCIFLDADIALFRNMDALFDDVALPKDDDDSRGGRHWLAANHACVCNLDRDAWAPDDWRPENCAYTLLAHPRALVEPAPVPHSSDPEGNPTHRLLNGGMFVYRPSAELWDAILCSFEAPSSAERLASYQFPDQDFLAEFFKDRWVSTGWQFNAIKTMRYWHEAMWRDGEVAALHYIVDKPWDRRVAGDGVAGHLGRDGVTHGWWWGVWDEWVGERREEVEEDGAGRGREVVEILEGLVARPLDEEGDRRQCDENSKRGLPVRVPDHPEMRRRSGSGCVGEGVVEKSKTEKEEEEGNRPGSIGGDGQ